MHAKLKTTLLVLLILLVLMLGKTVVAQTSAGFNLEWHVIGSGGGESVSASYRVNGTFGQTLTSQPVSGSANFGVSSGYWFGGTEPGHAAETGIYLPILFQ